MMHSKKETFDFGTAIYALKEGSKVTREGWNGKGMFLFLADEIEFDTSADLSCVKDLKGNLTLPSIVMKTADDKFVVGWLASQTDMLADDWMVFEADMENEGFTEPIRDMEKEYEDQQTEEKACGACGDCVEGLCGNGDSCSCDSEPAETEKKTDEESCAPPEDIDVGNPIDFLKSLGVDVSKDFKKDIEEIKKSFACDIFISVVNGKLNISAEGNLLVVLESLSTALANISVSNARKDAEIEEVIDEMCTTMKKKMTKHYEEMNECKM